MGDPKQEKQRRGHTARKGAQPAAGSVAEQAALDLGDTSVSRTPGAELT